MPWPSGRMSLRRRGRGFADLIYDGAGKACSAAAKQGWSSRRKVTDAAPIHRALVQ